ncbi:hypothetical protein SAMN06265379_1264 [Saccharicrinis carchari]|uniref:Uncharacterized protein n=2 Tax=Saccharicrinis carchari TaxID=1168039 RepID=A0A521FFT6_SACCC|nr:hypothetical protein SAMN06265379_1264 [Saccharicrinis carchari]
MRLPIFFTTIGTIINILFRRQIENFEYLKEVLFITFIISLLYLLARRIRLKRTHLILRNMHDFAIQITCIVLSLFLSIFLFKPWINGLQYYYFGIFMTGIFLISGLIYENSMQISFENKELEIKNLFNNEKRRFLSIDKIEIDHSIVRIIDKETFVEINGFRNNLKDNKKLHDYLTERISETEIEITGANKS